MTKVNPLTATVRMPNAEEWQVKPMTLGERREENRRRRLAGQPEIHSEQSARAVATLKIAAAEYSEHVKRLHSDQDYADKYWAQYVADVQAGYSTPCVSCGGRGFHYFNCPESDLTPKRIGAPVGTNYGILVAISEDGGFQIVGEVDNREEAKLLAREYIAHGPENNYLAPWEFQIHRRGNGGAYTNIDHLGFADTWVS
jgi:hypothetical protein